LSFSGENSSFFAQARIEWIKQKLTKLSSKKINKILDFGCGTGNSIPILDNVLKPHQLIGIDLSEESINISNQNYKSSKISFFTSDSIPKNSNCDFAYCNGVFHHIPPENRYSAVNTVYNMLSHNGVWAFCENNPWNPGTRYLMNKIPFDKDAITLSFLEAKKLLLENGFKIIDISFHFIFPRSLRFLRFSEKLFSTLPIGAQYIILAQKL
jgi:2-polyprenyl-3-methyl-5-hydroxy-6-metoxy-1,4-benzoquinol methylase